MARTKKTAEKPAAKKTAATENKSLNKIGALWLKRKGGNTFMSGVIELNGKKTNIIVFKNNYKTEDRHPDYNIILPRGEEHENDDIPF